MIHPLNGYVVAKLDNAEKKTASGLIVPGTAISLEAVVVAVSGSDVDVAVGDTVIRKPGSGILYPKNNEQYLLLNYKEDIVGKVLAD